MTFDLPPPLPHTHLRDHATKTDRPQPPRPPPTTPKPLDDTDTQDEFETHLDLVDSGNGNDASEGAADEVVRPLYLGAHLLGLHLWI